MNCGIWKDVFGLEEPESELDLNLGFGDSTTDADMAWNYEQMKIKVVYVHSVWEYVYLSIEDE